MADAPGHQPFAQLTVAEFVENLASSAPVPGGGSAAAIAGSLGAALVSMVAALSERKPAYAEHADMLALVGPSARALAGRFLDLADEDATAYAGFAVALKLPRETDEQRAARDAALRAAAKAAAEVPLRTVEAALQLAAHADSLAGRSNRNAASDVDVAAHLAEAAARGAAANVMANIPAMGDDPAAGGITAYLDGLLHDVDELVRSTREALAAGRPRDPERQPGAGAGSSSG